MYNFKVAERTNLFFICLLEFRMNEYALQILGRLDRINLASMLASTKLEPLNSLMLLIFLATASIVFIRDENERTSSKLKETVLE